MAKEVSGIIKLQIRGGSKSSTSCRSYLGQKVSILWSSVNSLTRTQDKAGKIVPVVITVFADKSFEFIIKTAAKAQLLEKKEKWFR